MKVQFADQGWEDYLAWQHDRQMLRRVNVPIENIRLNGHQGIGKPEQFRGNWSGFWSRRIDQEHRLVYRIVNDTVQIAQCRYHYERVVKSARNTSPFARVEEKPVRLVQPRPQRPDLPARRGPDAHERPLTLRGRAPVTAAPARPTA